MRFEYPLIGIMALLTVLILYMIAISPEAQESTMDVPEPEPLMVASEPKPMKPTNFEECADAGFPIMESFPRKCRTDEGQMFTEVIGESMMEEELTACTLEYAPVCGVDGTTYGNMCMLDAAGVDADYEGECEIQSDSMQVPAPGFEDVPEMIVEPEPVDTSPQTHRVSAPSGSSAPGCEETNSCFIPYSIEINAGDTVSWSNDDSAAHTVTSGNLADGGPDGIFDSSLFMASTTFDVIFDDPGTYDYFCMVHPWMVGVVQVN